MKKNKFYSFSKKRRGAYKYSEKSDMIIHVGFSKKMTLHFMRKVYRKHIGVRLVRTPKYRKKMKYILNSIKHPYVRHIDMRRAMKKINRRKK